MPGASLTLEDVLCCFRHGSSPPDQQLFQENMDEREVNREESAGSPGSGVDIPDSFPHEPDSAPQPLRIKVEVACRNQSDTAMFDRLFSPENANQPGEDVIRCEYFQPLPDGSYPKLYFGRDAATIREEQPGTEIMNHQLFMINDPNLIFSRFQFALELRREEGSAHLYLIPNSDGSKVFEYNEGKAWRKTHGREHLVSEAKMALRFGNGHIKLLVCHNLRDYCAGQELVVEVTRGNFGYLSQMSHEST